MLRSHTELKAEGLKVAAKIKKGSFFAVELAWGDKNSDHQPWVLCRAETTLYKYTGETKKCTEKMDETWMGKLDSGCQILYAKKMAPLSTGSNIFVESDSPAFWVFGEDVRVIDLQLEPVKQTRATKKPRWTLSKQQRDPILASLCVEKMEVRARK